MIYAWIILFDHLDEQDIDVTGPRGAPDELIAQLYRGEGDPFRLYDDDGELYFAGRILGDYSGFEPLEDYGTPDSGCTEIRYLNGSTWESL